VARIICDDSWRTWLKWFEHDCCLIERHLEGESLMPATSNRLSLQAIAALIGSIVFMFLGLLSIATGVNAAPSKIGSDPDPVE
jgi:hypothetical protein